jgi:hypothetical protein
MCPGRKRLCYNLSYCRRICCQAWSLVEQGGTSYCPTNAFPLSPRKSTPEEEEEEDVDKTGVDGGGDEERDEP